MKSIWLSVCSALLSVISVPSGAEDAAASTAFRETIDTPHWEWAERHAGGTVRALFITSFLGGREPEELAQRFDFAIDVVPVDANPSGTPTGYDEAYLTKALAAKPDVIVVPYRGAWGKLSEEAQRALVAAVAEGTPLIALSAGNAPKALQEERLPEREREAWTEVERQLAVERLRFQWGREGGRIGVQVNRCGAGLYLNVGMGHGAGGGFSAFIPNVEKLPASPAEYEIAYAVFARLIRWAAGKTAGPGGRVQWQAAPTLGTALPVTASLAEPTPVDAIVEWELKSPFGDHLAQGTGTIAAGATEVAIELPLPQAGVLTLLYRLRRNDGAVTDFGAVAVPVASPIAGLKIRIPEFIAPGQPVPVTWEVDGNAQAAGGFRLQVYDASGRLVARTPCAATARECQLDGWQPRDVRHRLRMLAMDGAGNILHEARVPLHVQVDRSRDLSQFHVMVWATENGDPQEQWRYHRLRQLGITALSPVGKGMTVPTMAAEAGLRLAPVNICVPPGRFKKEFAPAKEQAELDAYIQAIAPLSPLGYSLADEPGGVDLAGFRNWAAAIIRQRDPGAHVGYCGTHMKVGMDVPGILAASDFMIHYSPHYLYTSDLWRGIERDLHRAFTPAGSLNTVYTHYVPWRDHEPYSRVTPWLMLFEEVNGISYFASAGGNFSILNSDLRTTHETRWWSEEIRELQQGIATQLIAMDREKGGVALLFPTDLPEVLAGAASHATTLWAEALRELNLPYSFVAPQELATLDPATTPLLICPPMPVLSSDRLQAVRRYVEAGGTLIATAPFALVEPQPAAVTKPPFWVPQPAPPAKPEPDDQTGENLLEGEPVEEKIEPPPPPAAELLDIEPLFGIRRQPAGTPTREELFEAIAMRSRIPAAIAWTGEQPLTFDGSTAGQHGLAVADADLLATFAAPADEAPAFAKDALLSPAVCRVRRGKGTAYYFNLVPTPDAARALLPRFQAETGAAPAPARVTVDGSPAPAVYLYPMTGGGVRTLGIVQDYERVKPILENREVETAIYYRHGPLRWAEADARLELDRPVHLYDMRRQQYLGETASAAFALQPGRPELFALLPYRVTGIAVKTASAVAAGSALTVNLRIATEGGACGDHAVHVLLAPAGGTEEPTFSDTFMLSGGSGTVTVPTAFNDPAGDWVVQVTDVLSGTRSAANLRLEAPGDLGPLLPRQTVQVATTALAWPKGEWQPYQDPDAGTRPKVGVQVGNIQRTRINYGPFDGLECLHAKRLLRLEGRRASYQFTYLACNDWEKKGWQDKRQTQGQSLSGLGMNDPAAHLWYYNGYIDIYYDEVRVTGYRIANVKAVEAGQAGRVDVTWESPAGDAVLSFGLDLEGEPLLQQLLVRPAVAVATVKVVFRSYIGGFGQSNTRFVRTPAGKNVRVTEPTEAPWAFYADDVHDQAYGKGMGAGGILVLPEQWDRVQYGLTGELEKRVDLQPGQTMAFQWALWLYPKLTNEEAFEAFSTSTGPTAATLRTFFVTPQPAAGNP